MREKIIMWLAYHMPRRLAYWAFIRVATYATVGEYSHQIVPDLTIDQIMMRWPK